MQCRGFRFGVDVGAEILTEVQPKHDVRCGYGEQRGEREGGEPAAEGWHASVEDDKVGGVGDGENEGRGIRDHGAGEEVRQGLDFGFADGAEDGGGEHDGGGVVGHEHGDRCADSVDEREETGGAAVRAAYGGGGDPVEDAVFFGQLGQEHHADEEEVDVGAFGNGAAGELQGDEAKDH